MNSFIKLSPVLVLASLMVIGLDALIAAPIATIYAAIVAVITEKLKTAEILDSAIENVKQLQMVFFILMFAYAMASAFMATGVGASIVNISLSLGLTARTVAVFALLITSILSIATGTSWGTFAACAPIFLWLNHIVGGNILLTTSAVAGGACFGDNIGLISDTTIVSSGIQKVEVIHRIRHQGVWSGICLLLSCIIIFIIGVSMDLPQQSANAADAINAIPNDVMLVLQEKSPAAVSLLNQVKSGVPHFMAIPLVLVILFAVKGVSTLLCLTVGIFSSLILGLISGTVESIPAFLVLIQEGFAEAGSWVIVMMMWVGAFSGIMSRIGAFKPLADLVLRLVKSVRQLMFANGLLSLFGNAALSDEMAQIVTIGPIIKQMVDDNVEGNEEDIYKLRLRNATFSDALGVFGSQLIPWHVYIGYYIGIASAVYPLHVFTAFDIIKYNVLAIVAVVSILVLTLTGLDRFIPMFSIPSEPDVKLKRK